MILLIITIAVGGVAARFFFFPQAPAESQTGASNEMDASATIERLEHQLADIRRLKDLSIDTSILKSPLVQILEQPPLPLPQATSTGSGRPNPFLPF